jgi:hypothetical protein
MLGQNRWMLFYFNYLNKFASRLFKAFRLSVLLTIRRSLRTAIRNAVRYYNIGPLINLVLLIQTLKINDLMHAQLQKVTSWEDI